MRGPGLVLTVAGLVLCGAGLAQRVQFAPVEKSSVLQRMAAVPESDEARAARIKEMFVRAGCGGSSLAEQRVEGENVPNIICRLGTGTGDLVIVGAHYDRVASPERPLDNWSGASLLPALYESLRERKRSHSFVFVAFADSGNNPAGAEYFAKNLSPSQVDRADAMVNIDALGLSPTKVWAAHSDKDLVKAL